MIVLTTTIDLFCCSVAKFNQKEVALFTTLNEFFCKRKITYQNCNALIYDLILVGFPLILVLKKFFRFNCLWSTKLVLASANLPVYQISTWLLTRNFILSWLVFQFNYLWSTKLLLPSANLLVYQIFNLVIGKELHLKLTRAEKYNLMCLS